MYHFSCGQITYEFCIKGVLSYVSYGNAHQSLTTLKTGRSGKFYLELFFLFLCRLQLPQKRVVQPPHLFLLRNLRFSGLSRLRQLCSHLRSVRKREEKRVIRLCYVLLATLFSLRALYVLAHDASRKRLHAGSVSWGLKRAQQRALQTTPSLFESKIHQGLSCVGAARPRRHQLFIRA